MYVVTRFVHHFSTIEVSEDQVTKREVLVFRTFDLADNLVDMFSIATSRK